jgi:hypothetical protein
MNLEIVNLEFKLINFNFIYHACFLCCEPNLGLAAKGGGMMTKEMGSE